MAHIIADTPDGKYFVYIVGRTEYGKIIVETLDGKLLFVVEFSDLIFT